MLTHWSEWSSEEKVAQWVAILRKVKEENP